jgi:hypothetical protein
MMQELLEKIPKLQEDKRLVVSTGLCKCVPQDGLRGVPEPTRVTLCN